MKWNWSEEKENSSMLMKFLWIIYTNKNIQRKERNWMMKKSIFEMNIIFISIKILNSVEKISFYCFQRYIITNE